MIEFGGYISNLNSRMRQAHEDSRRRREQRNKVREAYRKISKYENTHGDGKHLSEAELKSLKVELRAQRRKADFLQVLAILLAIAVFIGIVWFLFFK